MTEVGLAILIGCIILAFKNHNNKPTDLEDNSGKKKKYIFLTAYSIFAIIGFIWVLAKVIELFFVAIIIGVPISLYLLSRKENKHNV